MSSYSVYQCIPYHFNHFFKLVKTVGVRTFEGKWFRCFNLYQHCTLSAYLCSCVIKLLHQHSEVIWTSIVGLAWRHERVTSNAFIGSKYEDLVPLALQVLLLISDTMKPKFKWFTLAANIMVNKGPESPWAQIHVISETKSH